MSGIFTLHYTREDGVVVELVVDRSVVLSEYQNGQWQWSACHPDPETAIGAARRHATGLLERKRGSE